MMSTKSDKSRTSADEVEQLAAQIDAIRGDLAGITDTISRLTRAGAAEAQDMARGKVGEAQQALHDSVGDVEAMVQRKPLQAALIALGVGFLIGMFARR